MRRKNYKYINGSKGVISIFLAVILLPFFSLAAMLVESAHYQSAVSIVDEIMGSASLSTLAGYDSYLQQRFGLLAVDESKIKDYKLYLDENKKILSSTIDIFNVNVQGEYPLADTDVLYRQVLEYSKLNAPTTMMIDGLDITSLVSKLEKATHLTTVFEGISNTGDVISETIDLVENMEKLKQTVSEYETSVSNFSTAYMTFQTKIKELSEEIKRVKEEKDNEADNGDGEAEGEGNHVQETEESDEIEIDDRFYTNIKNAQAAYVSAHEDLISKLNNYKSGMQKVLGNIKTVNDRLGGMVTSAVGIGIEKEIASKQREIKGIESQIKGLEFDREANREQLERLNEQKSNLENEISEKKVENTVSSSVKSGYTQMLNSLNKATEGYNETVITEICNKLATQKELVKKFDSSKVTEEEYDTTVYNKVIVNGVISSDTIAQYIREAQAELQQDSVWAQLKAISRIFESLFKTKGIFDSELNAVVDQGFYQTNYGGFPSQKNRESGTYKIDKGNTKDEELSKKIMDNINAANSSVNSMASEIGGSEDIITQILQDIDNFQSGFESTIDSIKSLNLVGALEGVRDLFNACKNLIAHLVQWLTEIGKRILELCIDKSAWAYEKLFFDEYLVKTLPNRTNYRTGSTMTGYFFSKINLTESRTASTFTGLDELAAIIQTIKSAVGGGSEKVFCGAELEYIIWGSRSEIVNQMSTFMMVYLLRLVLDLGPIFMNEEVATMAGAATIAAWAVYLIEVLAEPLVDTVILVNGEKISLWKSNVFLTPSGVVPMIGKFTSVLTNDVKSEIEKEAYNIAGMEKGESPTKGPVTEYAEGLLEMDYSEHLMLLMYLFGNKKTHLKRLSDIIQMEVAAKGTDLDIDHAYTCIRAEADTDVKMVLPIPDLSSKKWGNVKRIQYRGY